MGAGVVKAVDWLEPSSEQSKASLAGGALQPLPEAEKRAGLSPDSWGIVCEDAIVAVCA